LGGVAGSSVASDLDWNHHHLLHHCDCRQRPSLRLLFCLWVRNPFWILLFSLFFNFLGSRTYQGVNIFFITFNLILVVLSSIGSILPVVQEVKTNKTGLLLSSPLLMLIVVLKANPKSGLLQAAIIGAYTSYVIASSISSEPKSDPGVCAPASSDVFSEVLLFSSFFFFISFSPSPLSDSVFMFRSSFTADLEPLLVRCA